MPFPKLKFKLCSCGCSVLQTKHHIDEMGFCVDEICSATEVLPSVANFKLSRLVKAGVDLEQVSTQIKNSLPELELNNENQ